MTLRTLLGSFFLSLCVLTPAKGFAATLLPEAKMFIPNQNEFAAAIVMVPRTHQILYSFNPDTVRVAASLTKLANALVFLKYGVPWNKTIRLQKIDEVGGGRLRVPVGTTVSVRDLFYASITASANNASMAVARATGVSAKTFINKMNQTVRAIGAKKTVFYDQSGMDPRNVTTATEMALIAEAAFAKPDIRLAASRASYPLRIASTGVLHTMKSTDPLLAVGTGVWIVGGKTGYLEESLYNFVAQMRPELEDGSPVLGKDVIVVVFGAPTKAGQFESAKRLAQWAWNSHEFK